MRNLLLLTALTFAASIAGPASATGKITCDAPKTQWKGEANLVRAITAQGWKVRKAKVDGGCYEVYGTTPTGQRVEAYFHPVTFEKLLVSQRGKIIFKKS